MMGELLVEFLANLIFRPLLGAALSVALWGVHGLFYPPLLGIGWLRLWLRGRGRTSFRRLWQFHSHTGLHQAGWQQTVMAVEYSTAAALVVLALVGVGATLYAFGQLAGL